MAITVLSGNQGKVAVLEDPSISAVMRPLVSMPRDENRISFNVQRSIITRITVAQQGNFQFLHTIGNDIYIYVFGDRIGQLTLQGLSFALDCENTNARRHGMELMLDWYRQNKVAALDSPVRLLLGTTPLLAFVVGMRNGISDPATRIAEFSVDLRVLPERDDRVAPPELAGTPTETGGPPPTLGDLA